MHGEVDIETYVDKISVGFLHCNVTCMDSTLYIVLTAVQLCRYNIVQHRTVFKTSGRLEVIHLQMPEWVSD